MSEAGNDPVKVESLRKRLVLFGGVLLAICVVGGIRDGGEFFRSYLVAFLFWIGITLGCLALLMVQHLTGGNWALVIRRILEAGSRTLPLMAVAVLPLLAGMKWLYSWSRPGQTDSVILSKHLYLNPRPNPETETYELWNWNVAEVFIGSNFQNRSEMPAQVDNESRTKGFPGHAAARAPRN